MRWVDVAASWLASLSLGAGLAVFTGASAVAAAPSASSAAMIDSGDYPDGRAAEAVWQPMAGSQPVQVTEREGRKVLHFDCNFAGGIIERASWDRKVTLDLSACRGVQFQILCPDTSPVLYFSLFFQSGGGWYHGSFFPESASGWNTIRIDKADMSLEGTPRGWDHIEGVRLSAWRGKEVNTEFYLRDLRVTGVLGADALVAIVRGDASAQALPSDSDALRRSAATVLRGLQDVGIGCVLVSDPGLSTGQLAKAQLVILPRNPVLSAEGAEVLVQHVRNGGRLLAFHSVPEPLRSVARASTNCLLMPQLLLPQEAAGQGRMLLGLAGCLAPEVWRQSAEATLQRIGALSDFENYDQAVRQIESLAGADPAVAKKLTESRTLRESALKMAEAEKYAEAVDRAESARHRMTEAFCLAQKPEAGEFRAFWCHSAFGVDGIDWDEAIRRLAENGFTAVLPNMLWGGTAYYPSDVLPVAREVAQRGDQIAQCLAACRKYGVQMHVWKVNWNLSGRAPKAFVEKLRQEERLQATSQGKEEPWLCPSHPLNRQMEIESMIEIVRRYPVDGIHFDYIRFPDGDHCFCAGCRQRFQSDTGLQIHTWPQDVLPKASLRQSWLQWRRIQITSVVKAVSERARALQPKIKISAAVFPNWNNERDSIGQDWKLWCEQGYLDFVCPMDYTTSKAGLNNMVRNQVQWAGRTPCYPGLGVSATSPRLEIDQTIDQILITRRHKTGGFVIFNYGVPEGKELLPMLGLGITKRP